jgi:hypothetical protein
MSVLGTGTGGGNMKTQCIGCCNAIRDGGHGIRAK